VRRSPKTPKLLACAILAIAGWIAGGELWASGDSINPERIVSMGDVHGDFDSLAVILRKAGLVDDSLHWVGGHSIFVQLGDFTDRGARVRETMDLLMRLQEEASRQGGQVIVLMGNHEMMNVVGDYRYVPTEAYRAFVDEGSEQRRADAFGEHLKWLKRRGDRYGDPEETDPASLEKTWIDSHPLGFVEYMEAMGPEGLYGKWLRTLPAVVKVGDSIFVHGGINPSLSKMDLDDLNREVAKERDSYDSLRKSLLSYRVIDATSNLGESFRLVKRQIALMNRKGPWGRIGVGPGGREQLARILQSYLKMGSWLSMSPEGPLWYRGYATWTDQEGAEKIAEILRRYAAQRFVAAHTVVGEKRIAARFDGRLYLIDTLEPSALVLEDSQLACVYAAEDEMPSREPASSSESATNAQ